VINFGIKDMRKTLDFYEKSCLLNNMKKRITPRSLTDIPGVGKSIAQDLQNIGIHHIEDLKGMDPQRLYELSNTYADMVQDRCLLYVSP